MLIRLSIEEFGLPEIKWGWFGNVKGCWGLWGSFGVFFMGSKNPFQSVQTGLKFDNTSALDSGIIVAPICCSNLDCVR